MLGGHSFLWHPRLGDKMKQAQKYLWRLLYRIYVNMNQSRLLKAIRESMLMIVPVIMVGAAALVLRSFPIKPYLFFIQNFAGGIIDEFFALIYNATFGILAIYMVISLSVSYLSTVKQMEGNFLGAVFSSLLAFGISCGLFSENADIGTALGVKGLFTAIVCSLVATSIYYRVQKKRLFNVRFYTEGSDDIYHNMIRHILPILSVGCLVSLINLILCLIFGVGSFQELYIYAVEALFGGMERSFGSAILYVFTVHFLWFFGVHGGNVLDTVGSNVFEPCLEINAGVLAAGNVPTEIFSKSFFDIFVLMGGCGSTLCLLVAILLFEKNRSMRRLAKFAAVPGFFNMNELLLFGVPIVYNPIMMIPFFLTPLASLVISAVAMKLGLVPVVYRTVEWTTPILLGGYFATGSVSGAILQAVNLTVGVLIYRPFIRIMERQNEKDSMEKLKKLMNILQESEKTRVPVELLELRGDAGAVAKVLSEDLELKLKKKEPDMFYQPQYNYDGHCIGAEALLRWQHPIYGRIYPPLIIQLMEEINVLTEAEEIILETVLKDMDDIKAIYGDDTKISVNVTGITIQTDEYEEFLYRMAVNYPNHIKNLMLEVTEQASLEIDDNFINRLTRIKEKGFRLAIDDFSMGNTSVKYLQSNVFDMIKLDGSLTSNIDQNKRSRSIVRSLANMAKEFDIDILAEFVETTQQKEYLKKLGCDLYQGYLYSPAVPLDEFLDRCEEN